jgi:hypothetical protein
MAPVQWLLELAAGRGIDEPGIPLTMTGNLSRRVVQDAVDRFNWWEQTDRAPRSESDVWRLTELRALLQKSGAVRRSARRLVLGTRGRSLLDNPDAQWTVAMGGLVDANDFEGAAQEAALMLLLQAGGMVEVQALVAEVAEILGGSGWRDVGNGALPDELDVTRAVTALIRRCELWSFVELARGPGWTNQVRLSDTGRRGGYAALRALALRPRTAD